MNRAAWLQDRRMQKFRDVLSRWERGDLSMLDAGELLGMSERQFRRYRDRYEEEGLDGLVDRADVPRGLCVTGFGCAGCGREMCSDPRRASGQIDPRGCADVTSDADGLPAVGADDCDRDRDCFDPDF